MAGRYSGRVLHIERPRPPKRLYVGIVVVYFVLAALAYLGHAGLAASLLLPIPTILVLGGPFLFALTQRDFVLTEHEMLLGYVRWRLLRLRRIPLTNLRGAKAYRGKIAILTKDGLVLPRQMIANAWEQGGVMIVLDIPDKFGDRAFVTSPDPHGLCRAIEEAARAARQKEGTAPG